MVEEEGGPAMSRFGVRVQLKLAELVEEVGIITELMLLEYCRGQEREDGSK